MKKIISSVILLLIFVKVGMAQATYQPYSYQFYQKFNEELYSTKTRIHTALKSYIIDSNLQRKYDSLMNYGVDTSRRHSWLYRKIFNEHLFDVKQKDFTFFGDFMPDLVIGRDFSGHKTTWLNTRAYQLGGTVGKNFYFYSSGSENQAVFPEYLDTYINQVGIVPGRAYDRSYQKKTKDWSDVSAVVSYTPIKYLNITLGNDKTFIGDGYRSVVLSDYASNYPFLKLTANLGNVRYMAMWAYMTDPPSPLNNYVNGYNRKWGIFHYLDWNVSNRVSLGFFDAVIAADRDSVTNAHRGLDPAYLDPIVFLRPVEASNGSPDNAMIGFTGKYKITDGITAYGQFVLDEFRSVDFFSGKGSFRNKYSWQLGLKGANLFSVKNLNYLAEYNGALPYTYSETMSIKNYSEQGEPLAHPWGANFKELVGLLNYSYKRFDFSGELDYGHYGLDINGLNYGKDIFKLYNNPAREYGNYIGQGLTTNMAYAEGKVAYLLNPKYNLRIELGGVYRVESNSQFKDKTSMITIGLRSSFRQIYNDIASYQAH
ncbi:gliding motility protein RemB [Mucilaginibacter ximonensis]|uniref:Gliding motility protein RemB n=1 Tax=Mucilaginibacter ximonensis TaxID=538021 RepID=A0ABW5YGW0_9SPHI